MAYKVCSNCNEDNLEHSSVCSSCSHSLHNAKVYGAKSTDIENSALFTKKPQNCSNCSEKIDSDSIKCRYCGHINASVPSSYRSSYYAPQSSSNDNSGAVILLYIATFFIPIVGLIVGGIYALDNDPDKSSTGKGLIIFGLVMIILGAIIWGILAS